MAVRTGTHTMADLQSNRFQSAVEFGLTTIQDVLERDLAAHNQIVDMMFADLVDSTTDRQRIYGTSVTGRMGEADEFGRPVAVKHTGGATVGFPLRKFNVAVGWTRDYFMTASPAEIAETVLAVQGMHVRSVEYALKTALFTPTNSTFRDRYASPQIDLGVKALINADSSEIPNGPHGETFNGATHTHYDFLDGAAPTAAALTSLIEDVIEHGHGGRIIVAINRAAETAVRALTGFVPYTDPRLTLGTQANQPAQRLDITRIDNRAIGLFGAAEVWVKSWVPAGYVVAYDADAPEKPLIRRQHPVAAMNGLRIAARLDDYPLYADEMEAYYGFGVWNRTAAAVLYYAASASAYVTPTFS